MAGFINVSRVVAGIMAEAYIIIRSTGVYKRGGWATERSEVPGFGVVSVAKEEDLEMIPEADRVTGAMVFHSTDRFYLTETDSIGYGEGEYGAGPYGGEIQRVSDIIIWNHLQWRIMHVAPYVNRGYWRAIGVRIKGN